MKKMLLLCGALMLVAAASAMATTSSNGLGLHWNSCTGPEFNIYDCVGDNNTNKQNLVFSYTPAADVPDFLAITGTFIVATDGPLPQWWANGCTGKTPAAMFSYDGNTVGGCQDDAYAGVTPGGGAAGAPVIAGSTITGLFSLANDSTTPVVLTHGVTYFMCHAAVSVSKSTGTGVCAGCSTPACINFKKALFDTASQPTATVSSTDGPWVSWESNPATQTSCLAATPTHTSSWGQVKALYR